MLHAYNYNSWEFWETYDPTNHVYGNQSVTFDGLRRRILVNEGVTNLDVKQDIYSNWKEWVGVRPNADSPNSKWPQALSAIGGQPFDEQTIDETVFTQSIDATVFLENGWRILPWKSSKGYVLNITGNIFTREPGQNPVIPESNVTVVFTRSAIATSTLVNNTPIIDELAIPDPTRDDIAARVWTRPVITPDNNSYGELVQNMDSDLTITKTEAEDALKKTEFLALQ